MSAYRLAIEQTETAIQRRARVFRNQVVVVSLVSLATILSAAATRSFAPLGAVLVLVPLAGSFLFADAILLTAWRSTLMAAWAACDLDLAAFCHTIRVHPTLPKPTLEGMLATLPVVGELTEEQAVTAPTRQAIAAALTAIHRSRSDDLLFKVVGSAVAVVTVVAAIWIGDWRPLLALLSLLALPIVHAWLERRRLERLRAEIASCRADARFSDADYERIGGAVPY